jgi:hypothetical protein
MRMIPPPTLMYPMPHPKSHVDKGGDPGVDATNV